MTAHPQQLSHASEQVLFDKASLNQSIPARFEQQVDIFSDRIAICDNDSSITYDALDRSSNQIAHAILNARGDKEEPVTILFDQGAASVAAILGSLKAGKIYVPLDPSRPREELERIIGDCNPAILVTEGRQLHVANTFVSDDLQVLNVDEIDSQTPDGNPGVQLSPTRRCYIFYTSGSTGTPKGVVDNHRNVLHNVMRYTNSLRIGVDDRLSLIQSCGFSGTVSSLFSALLNGATVCPYDLHRHGIDAMANWINEQQLTIFHSVPMIFEQLLARHARFPSLRLIRLEGDQTFPRHVDLFKSRFDKNCTLVNGLGSTETGLVRQFFVTHDCDLPGNFVPIGYETEDMQVRLLDDAGQDVPMGSTGEIAVQSCYLAEGYWGQQELTNRKFVPVSQGSESRLFQTGDTGRFLADHSLEYLGRRDFRIKIRGQWMDTAAVEYALEGLPTIARALVTGREDSQGAQHLVAYLIAAVRPAPTVSTIRKQLLPLVPIVMLPARYVYLDEFPLNYDRKIDRRALPNPGRERPLLDEPFVAVKTQSQESIAACFSDVLDIDEIGIHDDFLELGGDSLMATELSLSIERRLGTPCPADFVYRERTVAALDRRLNVEMDLPCIVPMQHAGRRPPLFCLHSYSGQILEYRRLAELMCPEQPVYGVRSLYAMGNRKLNTRLEDFAAHYVREIRKIQPNGPYYLCGNCFGGLAAFEVAQQLRQQGQQVALLALIDTEFPSGFLTRLRRQLNVRKNLQELSQLPVRESVLRLRRKLRGFSGWIKERVESRIRITPLNQLMPTRHSSRDLLRRPVDFHVCLMNKYRPKQYSGALILICLTVRDNYSGWQRLTRNNLEIVQLPYQDCDLDNPHLVEEPFVRHLANALAKILSRRRK